MLTKTMRRVKFISGGEMHYGVIAEAAVNKASPDDQIEVQDAVLPLTWVMRRDECYDVPVMKPGRRGEYEKYIEQAFKAAKRHSDKIRAGGIGKIVRFPVGDSWAYYVIARVVGATVHLDWRGFTAERTLEPSLGYEGTMGLTDCLRYVIIDAYIQEMVQEAARRRQPPILPDDTT